MATFSPPITSALKLVHTRGRRGTTLIPGRSFMMMIMWRSCRSMSHLFGVLMVVKMTTMIGPVRVGPRKTIHRVQSRRQIQSNIMLILHYSPLRDPTLVVQLVEEIFQHHFLLVNTGSGSNPSSNEPIPNSSSSARVYHRDPYSSGKPNASSDLRKVRMRWDPRALDRSAFPSRRNSRAVPGRKNCRFKYNMIRRRI
jgi:hypothetical protein